VPFFSSMGGLGFCFTLAVRFPPVSFTVLIASQYLLCGSNHRNFSRLSESGYWLACPRPSNHLTTTLFSPRPPSAPLPRVENLSPCFPIFQDYADARASCPRSGLFCRRVATPKCTECIFFIPPLFFSRNVGLTSRARVFQSPPTLPPFRLRASRA